ncbi:MAG: BON domain-containing protein [Methylococcaceae bacterium]|nr:BON domain-containing protein [Methylococcaceae bacterium]
MKTTIIFIFVHLLLSGCSIIATGGAEITGLSLLHERRTSKTLLIDERIEITAGIELNSYENIRKLCHYNVTAYNGKVLVTGEAPTESLRNKIIQIIRKISGVKLVHNELIIAQPSSFVQRSRDTFITTKVKSSLSNVTNLPGFDATRVKVITENGIVYLLGLVHKNEGLVATEITRRVSGVKKVVKIFEYIE